MKQRGYETLVAGYVKSKLGENITTSQIATQYGEVSLYHNNKLYIAVFDNPTTLQIDDINRQLFAVHFTHELIYRTGRKLLTFETQRLLKPEVSYLLRHLKQMEKNNANLSRT
ncbi:hypothetical protein [Avibacterium paragallinarum]|uniref:Uncharacterized protein n=1 Tax=Avibacterium paragallinarum TaxID=728 RepID=A0A377I7Q1_AVIPA|nr:hypothetical protein [Avibacterium paragallinarum]RZN75246.1 hypothetical protein EC523_09105 [Avibacterium paragallinarum]STO71334.1 Uncharacterised protein [Avibacterium paragallinarum]